MESRDNLTRLVLQKQYASGMWLDLGDSPGCNGAGGDDSQFANDAELEGRGQALWLYANDYGRTGDGRPTVLGSMAGFVSSSGCAQRTVVVGDGFVHADVPAIDIRSEYALRLDPARDHEGAPDRRWYFGANRSIASDEPSRSGTGLSWVEFCLQ